MSEVNYFRSSLRAQRSNPESLRRDKSGLLHSARNDGESTSRVARMGKEIFPWKLDEEERLHVMTGRGSVSVALFAPAIAARRNRR